MGSRGEPDMLLQLRSAKEKIRKGRGKDQRLAEGNTEKDTCSCVVAHRSCPAQAHGLNSLCLTQSKKVNSYNNLPHATCHAIALATAEARKAR